MVSDANLVEGGANIRDDGSLEVTKNQIKNSKQEMESEQGHYLEKASVNEIDFSVGWDREYQDYTICFPLICYLDGTYGCFRCIPRCNTISN